jgi:opacity protein-like surface antigen
MMRRALVLSSLLIMLAGLAPAQPGFQPLRSQATREGRWEFSLQTRYTGAQDYAGAGGSSVEFQDDLGWGFGFNYHFNQRFDLGLLISWRSLPYNAVAIDGDDGSSRRYNGSMSISTMALAGEWNVLPGKITPYVSGAVGWTLIDTNIYAGTNTGCWWDPWWGYICGDYATTYGKNTASFLLGAGGRFEVTESFFLRVGYEHAWTDIDAVDSNHLFRLDIGFMN